MRLSEVFKSLSNSFVYDNSYVPFIQMRKTDYGFYLLI